MKLILKTTKDGNPTEIPFEYASLVEAQRVLSAMQEELAAGYRQTVQFSGSRSDVDRYTSTYTGGNPTDGQWRVRDYQEKPVKIFGIDLRAKEVMYSTSIGEVQ